MRGQKQKYPAVLREQEVEQLESVLKRGKHTPRECQRAQMLLWRWEGKPDIEIAVLTKVTPLTVATTRERWVKEKRIADAPKLGRESWTLQVLADKLVELQVVEEPIS